MIRAIVVKAIKHNQWQVTGIMEGWKGLLKDGKTRSIALNEASGILGLGGTILKTSRTNPVKKEGGISQAKQTVERLKLDAIVSIGGEDTQGVANALYENGIPIVGVPKTIDNDLEGTDYCFGFDTAVNTVVEAIDRVRTTTESHKRVMVVEVMGRHAGWIALQGGIAGGADAILIPERPTNIDELCALITHRHENGKDWSIVVAAEGATLTSSQSSEGDQGMVLLGSKKDEFGHVRLGGVGQVLAREIEDRTGYETREVILGHVQRGGSPTAYDRYMCTRFGLHAVRLIEQGQFGRMVTLKNNQVTSVPLADVAGKTRTVPPELFEEAAYFFG